jgi:hypothetical protein
MTRKFQNAVAGKKLLRFCKMIDIIKRVDTTEAIMEDHALWTRQQFVFHLP